MLPVRHRILLALALVLIACGGCGSASDGDGDVAFEDGMRSVLVRWRASDDVAGYVIHWGRVSRAYTDSLDVGMPAADVDGVIAFALAQDGPGGTIFFALTSYDASGRMSVFSNELSALLE